MRFTAIRDPYNRRQAVLSVALCSALALSAVPTLAGEGELGSSEIVVPGDWNGGATQVGFVDPDLLRFHLECITELPPPDPIGPVVTLLAHDWDGDRIDEVGGFDKLACELIEPAAICDVLGPDPQPWGPDPSPWDPDPVSWNVIAGDWNGDGRDTLAVYDLATCETVPLADAAADSLILPEAGAWRFLAGDWDGSGEPSLAMARPMGLSGARGSTLFAGRWNGEHDSLAAVEPNGAAVLWNFEGDLHSALQSNEVPLPGPGEVCLDFQIECWTIAIPGVGNFKLCHRRRCCLGEGCYDYLSDH